MNNEEKQLFDTLVELGWHIAGFEEVKIDSSLPPDPHTAVALPGGGFMFSERPAIKLTLTRESRS